MAKVGTKRYPLTKRGMDKAKRRAKKSKRPVRINN